MSSFTAKVRLSQRFSHRQDTGGNHGKEIHAHSEKCFCELRVRGDLSADPHPASLLMSGVHNHTDHSQDRGMMVVVFILQKRVLSVHGKRILRKIVGPYAE